MGMWEQADKSNTGNAQKKTSDFYTTCVEMYHNIAHRYGFMQEKVIFIPELAAPGQKIELSF